MFGKDLVETIKDKLEDELEGSIKLLNEEHFLKIIS